MKLDEQKVYIVAELSANHKQQKAIALESIRVAADCGADAIKVQTYTPDTLTIDCDNEYFRIRQGTIWDGRTLYNLYQEAYTPWEWHPELKQCAEDSGLDFFSSPFDRTAVDLLSQLGVGAYKIASFEINDLELIDYVCAPGQARDSLDGSRQPGRAVGSGGALPIARDRTDTPALHLRLPGPPFPDEPGDDQQPAQHLRGEGRAIRSFRGKRGRRSRRGPGSHGDRETLYSGQGARWAGCRLLHGAG